MNNKIIKSLLALTLFLLLLSAVYASDDLTVCNKNIDDTSELLSVSESYDVKESNATTFSELSDEISNCSEGDTIVLKNQIIQDGSSEILINKSITIIGNENFINANHTSRIFNITANNVVLKDIVLLCGNATGFGGAIHWSGDNGTLQNCLLTNNNIYKDEDSQAYGGAVVWYGQNGVIDNCYFFNNTAEVYGGAVRWNAPNGTIKKSTFSRNFGLNAAGALYLYRSQNALISDCSFSDNNGYTVGGAAYISYSPNLKLTNSSFINNTAETNNGGALYFGFCEDYIISGCNFSNNTAKINGGVFYSSVANGLITECIFDNNTAIMGSGGALNWNGDNSNLTKCIFINNRAEDSGAIDALNPNGIIRNCSFINNRANTAGGIISWAGDNGLICDCNFLNASCGKSGGAVYWLSNNKNGKIINCTFRNILGQWGGAIRWETSTYGQIINSTFINCTSTDLGGALYWRTSKYGVIHNCTFINCQSRNLGGAVYWREGNDGLLYNCDFINCSAVNGGGAVNWGGENGKIVNCNFNHSSVKDNGAVIEWGGAIGNITNCIISNSDANYSVHVDGFYDFSGLVYLENNNFDKVIYVYDGGIISPTYLNVLDNKTVYKYVNAPMTLNAVIYDDNKNIVEINKKLTYVISNGDEISTSKNNFTVEYTFNETGEYYVNAKISNFKKLTVLGATVIVDKIPTEILIQNETLDMVIGDVVDPVVSLMPSDAGNLSFVVSDENVIHVNDYGVVMAVGEGNATVTVSFEGNEVYLPSNATINVTVSKVPTEISANTTESLFVDDEANITYKLTPEDAEGDVRFMSNDTSVVYVDAETGIIDARGEGTATISVSFFGTDKYAPSNTTVTVTVSKVAFEPEIAMVNSTLTVAVPENATGNVTLTIGNETFVAPIKDGVASFDLSDVPAGDYNATVTYPGDDKYAGFDLICPVSIENDFFITAENLTKYYHGPERFVVNLTDSKGNPIANANISIYINGRNYTRTTDNKGQASMAIGLNAGEYPVVVTYNGTSVDATVTVLPTVNGTDIIKVFRNATQYWATFRDSQGNYLPEGTTVTFNIRGVMYERKVSGDKGLARLNINLEAGEYIITAMNPVTGDMTANNITVLSRITENADLVKYYRNASQYTVKVLGDDGKAVGAGESVTFNINGVFYTRQTDANGIAKLNINLQPGDYVITAEYKGCVASNNIKVLPVLNATDINMKYRDGTQFKATLVDGQGKPYAYQSVTFNINGVFYNKPTDSSGTAKLNINLMPGEYIITSMYNGMAIANTITIKD